MASCHWGSFLSPQLSLLPVTEEWFVVSLSFPLQGLHFNQPVEHPVFEAILRHLSGRERLGRDGVQDGFKSIPPAEARLYLSSQSIDRPFVASFLSPDPSGVHGYSNTL
jgi:hypothetical protein